MDKSTHEELLSQPLQTNNKQFKIAVTLLMFLAVFSMLQIQIISFISRKQLLTEMILFKLLFCKVLRIVKLSTMKLGGLL